MAEKITTRAVYDEALVTLVEEYPELVVLDADSSGSTMTKGFAKTHPDRFYSMDTTEVNMTGVVTGLAACGKKPFIDTFAMPAAGRAWKQMCNSIAYPRLNVKVVGPRGGLSAGEDGVTHQCVEDYAIIRAILNMMVVSPCNGPEMRQAVRALSDYDGPTYLRLGRLAVENATGAIPGYISHLGQSITLRDGSGATIIATSMVIQMASKTVERLAKEGLSVQMLDMHTIKSLDGELVLKAALETGAIVTTEEASVVGGLDSAVAGFLAEYYPMPVVCHGVNNMLSRFGKAEAVLEAYGLTPEDVAEKVRHVVEWKKRRTSSLSA